MSIIKYCNSKHQKQEMEKAEQCAGSLHFLNDSIRYFVSFYEYKYRLMLCLGVFSKASRRISV